ncbi:biotin transporter BioY [Phenylobacterium sp.]|uniref:biotin transporter BioY n=1 Tax=Phenylobacterium sp. TaxID=1871053 RepID=UPI00272133B4|nr:biotin transporter BioY [Phenylobacterium sp.]MDO8379373.1 biotin transporter BioY [Phenylobacterium sp.]
MTSTATFKAPLDALLAGRSLAWRVGAVLAGSWLLAASSWAEVSMYPVPMTLQTYALLVIAGLSGPRLALEIVVVWLAQAAMGLPLLADGASGLAPFVGPTAGYLLGFVITAGLIGWLAARPDGRSWRSLTASFLAAHALILLLGWAWLATGLGAKAAFASGVAPFLAGAFLKTILAVATVKLAGDRILTT